MARFVRHFTADVNVLEAAKARIRQLYEEYDNVIVSYSGGKDSLAVLHLCRQVAIEEMGITDKVITWFRDEEVIHDSIIEFVDEYRQMDWIDMHWWVTPLQSHKYLLGILSEYVQWDPARDPANGGVGFVRPKPDFGVSLKDLGLPEDTVLSQYTGDEVMCGQFTGSTVTLTGIRTAESLLRYRAIMAAGSRGPSAWLGQNKRAVSARPIYDWQENDIFRYFYDEKIRYAPIYDSQLFSRQPLRVGTVITSEAAKQLDKLRVADPDLFDRVVTIWPEMATQWRYWSEYDLRAVLEKYGASYEDIECWVEETQTGKFKENALMLLAVARRRGDEHWNPEMLMRGFLRGEHKRGTITA